MIDEFILEHRYDFPKVIMYKYTNGIVHFYIKEGQHLDMLDVEPILQYQRDAGMTDRYLNLYEFGEDSDADNDVRNWAAKDSGGAHTIADAFVIRSLAQKIIADFYLKFHRPLRPTRVFNNRANAVKWLLKFND